MAADLDDPLETRSFLVPAYEFGTGADARKFDPDRYVPLGPVKGSDDTYRLIAREERSFQPLASSQFLFSAAALFNLSVGQGTRPLFIRLQDRPEEKPAGVRSLCLTVEGRRLSPRHHDGRIELVPSYAAWQTMAGGLPPWVSRIAYSLDGPGNRVIGKAVNCHWSGRGALCAVTPDQATHLLLVQFHVYDDNPTRSDLLKIQASRCLLDDGAEPSCDPTGAPLSPDWRQLLLRARRGFIDECDA